MKRRMKESVVDSNDLSSFLQMLHHHFLSVKRIGYIYNSYFLGYPICFDMKGRKGGINEICFDLIQPEQITL